VIPSAFENWRLIEFPAPADKSDTMVRGSAADHDHDGICNFLECAFSLEPRLQDTSCNPLIGQEVDKLTFIYRLNKSATDFVFDPQVSSYLDGAT
jgi:hypothetical protein